MNFFMFYNGVFKNNEEPWTIFAIKLLVSAQPAFTCSKLTTETLEQDAKYVHRTAPMARRFGVFIVNFERVSHFVLVFLLLTLSRLNAGWAGS